MGDFVVYHNPDTMGYSAEEAEGLNFVTKKNIPSVIGRRVWLITGVERPRDYYLIGQFTPTERSRYSKGGFAWLVEGPRTSGVKLPKPRWAFLNGETWFDDFRRSQGNFGLGLQAIREKRYITGLETVLEKTLGRVPAGARR